MTGTTNTTIMTALYPNHMRRGIFIIVVVGLLAACAPAPSVPQTSSHTLNLRRMQTSLDRQEQMIQKLADQVASLEKLQQKQAQDIAQLRQTKQPGHSAYQPVNYPQGQGDTSTPLQGDGSPTEVYLQAFGDYASGRYQTAIYGFETFLQRFPNNSYASNAQFWLGDCYFNQQQYPLAIQEFERVIEDYPNAAKTPDAFYKIAIAQLQLGATEEALQAVELLKQRYPKSLAAQKAQELAIP